MSKKFTRKAKDSIKKITPKFILKIVKLREVPIINKGKNIIKKISPDFTILSGPFKGMKYPSINISELALVPKIVGSYENHLIPLINEIIKVPYNNIIDVGCAEGYYAVGLARLMPQTTVHCYDINKYDLEFCKKMAEVNNAFNLTYNKFCSPDTLINFNYGERSLIICDCEGYELKLFTDKVVHSLNKTDVLIELHDVLDPIISSEIKKKFGITHNVTIINNGNNDYSPFQNMNYITREENAFVTLEHRGGLNKNIFMEWAFCTPKAINKMVGEYV